jgi:hypothetical protein
VTVRTAMEELLQVLFYKMYTTPRRYVSNVRMIFQVKTMLGLDDDAFRKMCEDLDEGSLRASIPEVMKRSLDGLEKELDRSDDSATLESFMKRPAGAMNGTEKVALALLYLDAGVVARSTELLKQVLETDRSNGHAWMHLPSALLSNLPASGLPELAVLTFARVAMEERLAALRMKDADELYIRELFSLPWLDESDRSFAAGQQIGRCRRSRPSASPPTRGVLRAGCARHRHGDRRRRKRAEQSPVEIPRLEL